jgi:aldose 1-epimerase
VRTLSLRAGDFQADLCPELGGALTGLWCGGVPVLRPTNQATSFQATSFQATSVQATPVRDSACYPLVPYSNRIAHARLHWGGQHWPLTPNFSPEPHAIHGTGWRTAWDVLDSGADHASLQHNHAPDADWPFAFECAQHVSLDDGGLSLRLVFKNTDSATATSNHTAPCGLGWHPYFAKDPHTQVHFTAGSRWAMGPDKLPTQAVPHSGLSVATANLVTDHCFSGWPGVAHLRTSRLHVTVTSSLPHLVVFTDPARAFIAIEPVSHVNNALGVPRSASDLAALGVIALQAGQTFEATLRIEARPRPDPIL